MLNGSGFRTGLGRIVRALTTWKESGLPTSSFLSAALPVYQKQALADIRAAFERGKDVVLVRAPTGSGKSLLARAIAGWREPPARPPPTGIDAYYTTPQVSQLDDVAEDALLADLKIIRGKSNYNCIIRGEEDTPVDRAPCARKRVRLSVGTAVRTSPTAPSPRTGASPR